MSNVENFKGRKVNASLNMGFLNVRYGNSNF